MPLCFYHVSDLFFGIEIAKHKLHSLQPCKFLTDNNMCWTINGVYRYFAGEENIIEQGSHSLEKCLNFRGSP